MVTGALALLLLAACSEAVVYDNRYVETGRQAARDYVAESPRATREEVDDYCSRTVEAIRLSADDEDPLTPEISESQVDSTAYGCHDEVRVIFDDK